MTITTNREELLADALRLADDLIDGLFMAHGSLLTVRARHDLGRPPTPEQMMKKIEDVGGHIGSVRSIAIERYLQLMKQAYPPRPDDVQTRMPEAE